jgi:UDP-N-acetylmuramyl pentapeptide phosphotransferase/UDP-N-acetylglucosamine-1-phosphate transferase
MLLGALLGAVLVLHTNESLAIAVPFALVVAITGLTSRIARDQGAWIAFP